MKQTNSKIVVILEDINTGEKLRRKGLWAGGNRTICIKFYLS